MHSFDYGIIQYYLSDIEYFFSSLKKKGSPKIHDLLFKTHPICKENHLKMLVNCNINTALSFNDRFYVTFVIDNGRGGDYNKYVPTEYLIKMENVSDIEDVSMIIRDKLGIKEAITPFNIKKLEKLDFHTYY